MHKFIQNIHKKPEHTRRRIAGISSVAIFLLILGAWVVTVPGRIARINGSAPAIVEGESPLQNLRASVKDGFQSIRDGFSQSAGTSGDFNDSYSSEDEATSSDAVILEDENSAF